MSNDSVRILAIKHLHDYINEYMGRKREPTDIAYDIVDLASVYPAFCEEEKEPILSKIWAIATQLELPEDISDVKHDDGWKELIQLASQSE